MPPLPVVTEMVERLEQADHGSRTGIVEEYSSLTGRSVQTLYRLARQHGYRSGRKPRRDKGERKSGLTDDHITYVAGLVEKTGRENKGGIMPVWSALEIAHDAGIVERGSVSVSTVHRYLRQKQLDKESLKAPAPHTEMRSLHPNHVHSVDTSVCIQYYLKKGGLAVADERDFYKNKPANFAKIKQKLLRYVIVDHFSGLFYVRYYAAAGEGQQDMWDFLKHAWAAKADERLLFRGVPKLLLADGGSPVRSAKALRNAIERLSVQIPTGMPYNPRRQGGAEGAHNLIETAFETKLRIQPAQSLDDLNQWAEDFMIWSHATRVHRRHGLTRSACWLQIQADQLRLLPDADVIETLFSAPQECTVVNYRIRFGGDEYNLKHLPSLHHRAKVTAHVNPWRWKEERVLTVEWQGVHHDVAAIKKLDAALGGYSESAAIIGQEYKAQPVSPLQRAKEEIEAIAGTAENKKAVPFAGTPVFGHYADKVGNLVAIPRAGTPLEISRTVVSRQIPLIELFKRLLNAGVSMTPELNRELKAELGPSVEVEQAESIVGALSEGREWKSVVCRVTGDEGERQVL